MPSNAAIATSGVAHVEVEFFLSAEQRVTLDQGLLSFEQINFTESVYEPASVTIGLRCTSPVFVDRVLKKVNAGGTPWLRFRFGLGDPGTAVWLPWQTHIVVKADAAVTGSGTDAGHRIVLLTADPLAMIDRSRRTASHRGTVSAVVRQIAERHNLPNPVIEDTDFEGQWIQSNLSDTDFIRLRLLPRARSKQGRGNYYFFMRDGALHFHSLAYETSVTDVNYYASAQKAASLTDHTQELIEQGAGHAHTVYHDPYTGVSAFTDSSADNALKLADTLPALAAVPNGELNLRMHMGLNREPEITALTQNAYESARSRCFVVRLALEKTYPLRCGHVANLLLDPADNNASAWSGNYLISHCNHVVREGALTSVYVLQRGEQKANKGISASLLSRGVTLAQETENARGIAFNPVEATASLLTRGSPGYDSSGAVLSVQSANSATAPTEAGKIILPK